MNQIPVLNKGYLQYVDSMGNDLSIVRSARVSYNADWRTGDNEGKDEKLIHYLMKNRHTTPFEAVTVTFEIKAPIFVVRQWHRHRTFCLGDNTNVIFNRPCDGRAYPLKIQDVLRKFNDPAQRAKLCNMQLRYSDGQSIGITNLTDIWYSGKKRIYKIKTSTKEITASKDHLFLTTEGWLKVEDLSNKHVLVTNRRAEIKQAFFPDFSTNELKQEIWKEFTDGYEISNLGRVRSYYRQGSNIKNAVPKLKQTCINNNGRAVVSINNKALQVSRIVAEAFLGTCRNKHVLHKDDNPLNNKVNNLYIGTDKDNKLDIVKNGRAALNRITEEKILSIKYVGYDDTFDLSVACDEHNFIANGFVTHNSYNEISARYTELPDDFYVPEPEVIGTQSKDNKQMRDINGAVKEQAANLISAQCSTAFNVYQVLLEQGVPRELARTVLPVATYTKFFATGNLHNWFHFLELRLHEHAQYEIKQYALAILVMLKDIVPIATSAFINTRLKGEGYP